MIRAARLACLVAACASAGAVAQYTADGPEDLQPGAGVRYFGVAKDVDGAYLADVSFLFEAGDSSFVFATGATGRFHGLLPLDTLSRPVTTKCWKAGFETVRVLRRPGAKSARPTVQVDCVLRRPASRATAAAKTTAGAKTTAAATTAMRGADARRTGWALVEAFARASAAVATPRPGGWHSSDAVFADASAAPPPTPSTASREGHPAGRSAAQSMRSTGSPTGEPEILIETYYNDVAYRHVRTHALHSAAALQRLRASGEPDPRHPGNRTIPPMPEGAMIVLAAWWPIARDRPTPLPVWDPGQNPPLRGGNHYLTWKRVVAVLPPGGRSDRARATARVEFGGRSIAAAPTIPPGALLQSEVDAGRATRSMRDPRLRLAAVLALGRPLAAGDRLALVAAHVIGKSQGEWRWATLWWHDQPDRGPQASGRPNSLSGAWRNYLLDVAVDPGPTSAGEPGLPATFNPWLEARFPDGGEGGGVSSHCIACHRRASYPAVRFLPVTRGPADASTDAAFAPGQLRTDFIWGIARQNVRQAAASIPAEAPVTDELLIERLR